MITIKVYKGNNTSSEFKTYNLDNDKLKTFETYNDFMSVNEKGEYTIERWIHINEYGGYTIEKRIETGKIENFSLYKGINVIEIDSRRSQTKIIYIIENPYTKAIDVKIKNKMEVNNQGIMQEVSKKVGKEEIISSINQSPEKIKLKASKIEFEGAVTANGNVRINENGTMEIKDIINERGVYTTLTFNDYRKSVETKHRVHFEDWPVECSLQDVVYRKRDEANHRTYLALLHNAIHLYGFVPKDMEVVDIRVYVRHKPYHWYDWNENGGEPVLLCVGNAHNVSIYKKAEFKEHYFFKELTSETQYETIDFKDNIKNAFGNNDNGYNFEGDEFKESINLLPYIELKDEKNGNGKSFHIALGNYSYLYHWGRLGK